MLIPPPLSGDVIVMFLFLTKFMRAEIYLPGKVYSDVWWLVIVDQQVYSSICSYCYMTDWEKIKSFIDMKCR